MSDLQNRNSRENNAIGGQESDVNTLLSANDLVYPMIKPLSLVTQKRLVAYPALQSTLQMSSSANAHIYISSGDDYGHGKEFFLRFKLTCATASPDAWSGSVHGSTGSVLSAIRKITLIHSSGTQIDVYDNFNAYSRAVTIPRLDKDVHDNGFSPLLEVPTTGGVYYSIPLKYLSDLFNQKKLIPSYMLSGMKLSVQFEDTDRAFATATAQGAVTISEIEVYASQYTLSDSAMISLQEISARGGMHYSWASYNNVNESGVSGNLNLKFDLAVSQALDASVMVTTETTATPAVSDQFEPSGGQITKYQYKLGSNHFPVQELIGDDLQHRWFVNNVGNMKSMSYANWQLYDKAIMVVNLERNVGQLNMQGHPVSSGRSLNLRATIAAPAGGDVQYAEGFMRYVKVAKVLLFDRVLVQS